MELIEIEGVGSVSRICLGTWAMGGWCWGGTERNESVKTIHRALDMGINFIDTAPVYGFGKSEELVGAAIAEYGARDKVVIATKTGHLVAMTLLESMLNTNQLIPKVRLISLPVHVPNVYR